MESLFVIDTLPSIVLFSLKGLLFTGSFPAIVIFTILALVSLLILTFYVDEAKKQTGRNVIYLFVAGLFIGLPGLRASALNNPFYIYMVILIWNLIAGILHIILSGKILTWPKTEAFGWQLLFNVAIVMVGYAGLISFMKLFSFELGDEFIYYDFSAVLTFFIPLLVTYAYECYIVIPSKIYLPEKPWVYNKSNELQFRSDDTSHFFIIRYQLTTHQGGDLIDSLPMRAPGHIKFGNYFNSTLECYKVTQGRYSIGVRDLSNNYIGWYFFLADGKSTGKLLDPNKTLLECGLTNPVYFGNSSSEEIEMITKQADREGRTYTIVCKREQEYKSQLLSS